MSVLFDYNRIFRKNYGTTFLCIRFLYLFRFVFVLRALPLLIGMAGLLCAPVPAGAELLPPAAPKDPKPSPNWAGSLGLNTVPSARMDKSGTMRFHLSTLDPYATAALSMQIADPLNITLRQNGYVSNLREAADRLYPAVDLKIRLLNESAYRPEIALGLMSAYGHKQMAAEYLALSKRYNNFDFTGGLGWGRMASAGHFSNPLKVFGSHFERDRDATSEDANGPDDWFTGDKIGLFAGVEYFTPINGLSLKADWGADDYSTEALIDPGYDAPDPWSVGLHYQPTEHLGFGLGILGGEKIMASVNISGALNDWPYQWEEPSPEDPSTIQIQTTRANDKGVWANLYAHDELPIGMQIGRALRHLTEVDPEGPAEIYITPSHYGLTGPTLRMVRRDVAAALSEERNGSPAEIWRNMTMPAIVPTDLQNAEKVKDLRSPNRPFASFRFILDNQMSLSEEDGGILHRESLVQETQLNWPKNITVGGGFRLNFSDDLESLSSQYLPVDKPVRSDVAEFAGALVSVDRLYGAFMQSLSPDIHAGFTAGYLEEMYAGFGGEILYRPFGKTFAIGAEGWNVWRRDPYSDLVLDLQDDSTLTGFFNAWYEFPDSDLTAGLKVGRYLGEDFGATVSLDKRMDSGVRVTAFVTASEDEDPDIFGGTTHLYSGLRLTLPLGTWRRMVDGSEMRTTIAPLGRNAGQALDTPLPLYDVSEPLSYRAISRSWDQLQK